MVGRDSPDKNPLGFIAALAEVITERPWIKGVLVGRGFTRGNVGLTARLRELRLDGRVILAGEQTNVPMVMAALDVFVLPSLSEGFPNVVAEAMAMQRLCVATDAGDAGAIVGDCGIVVPAGSHGALVAGILGAIELSPEVTEDVGRRARTRIQRLFSIDHVVGQFTDVYRQLMQQSATSDR
jgi:glycosyltransferase involved in cell wall biosynthesis